MCLCIESVVNESIYAIPYVAVFRKDICPIRILYWPAGSYIPYYYCTIHLLHVYYVLAQAFNEFYLHSCMGLLCAYPCPIMKMRLCIASKIWGAVTPCVYMSCLHTHTYMSQVGSICLNCVVMGLSILYCIISTYVGTNVPLKLYVTHCK